MTRGKVTVGLRTAKKRSISSSMWLHRHINDEFVQRAHKDGYCSRAAYKLIEINENYSLFTKRSTKRVLDLGSAPGSWSEVVSKYSHPDSEIWALDLKEMHHIDGVNFIQCDFLKDQDELTSKIGKDTKFDVILSDMAASASGHQQVDHLRIMLLCEEVLYFALQYLSYGGTVVSKVLQGRLDAELMTELKKHFKHVKYFKPKASRANSSEVYIIAQLYYSK